MGTLQVDALHALIGTGRTQAVAANVIGSGICPGVYQAVAQNLGWLLDLCDQACLREP